MINWIINNSDNNYGTHNNNLLDCIVLYWVIFEQVDTGNSSHRTVDQVTDPLSDNSSYLDKALRARLLNECGIQSTVVVQCLGDALFLPAMTPYQVRQINK